MRTKARPKSGGLLESEKSPDFLTIMSEGAGFITGTDLLIDGRDRISEKRQIQSSRKIGWYLNDQYCRKGKKNLRRLWKVVFLYKTENPGKEKSNK